MPCFTPSPSTLGCGRWDANAGEELQLREHRPSMLGRLRGPRPRPCWDGCGALARSRDIGMPMLGHRRWGSSLRNLPPARHTWDAADPTRIAADPTRVAADPTRVAAGPSARCRRPEAADPSLVASTRRATGIGQGYRPCMVGTPLSRAGHSHLSGVALRSSYPHPPPRWAMQRP